MEPYPLFADAGSGSCLCAAKPFVESDAAESRVAQRHQRALLDAAGEVSGLAATVAAWQLMAQALQHSARFRMFQIYPKDPGGQPMAG